MTCRCGCAFCYKCGIEKRQHGVTCYWGLYGYKACKIRNNLER